MLDKDYIIENITEEQILDIMSDFGANPRVTKTKEIWFNTICHGGDSNKLCYFRDSKEFNCYTNCGKMNIFGLVMHVKNCTFYESIVFVGSKMGIGSRNGFITKSNGSKQELNKLDKYINLRKHKEKPLEHLKKIKDYILKYFENDVFYSGWIEEGISIESMEKYNIMWYELEKHIIIPHYNINNELIGIRRRSLQEKDKKNKYMPEIIQGIEYGHSLGMNLFGLNINKDAIKKYKKVVIVESEKSVLLSDTYYGENSFVVATCGFNISNWQRDILLSLGIEEVILGFDKDFEIVNYEDLEEDSQELLKYKRYVKRIYNLAYKFVPYCRTYVLWDNTNMLDKKDSPFDKGKEVLEILMKNKKEITTDREGDNDE